jgi:Sec-independent protein secretion pathway component TatC
MMRICVSIHEGVPSIVSVALKTGVGAINEMRVSEYVQLLLSLTLAFALAFQAPVVVLLLGWVGILNQEILSKYRRHAILACAIIAAAIAPGDPASMLLLLLPLYILYELGGILLRIFPASRVAGKREVPDDDDDYPRGRDPYAPPFDDVEPEEQPDGIEPAGRRE